MTVEICNIMFIGGLVLAGASLLALVAGTIVFSVKKKKLNSALTDRYGY